MKKLKRNKLNKFKIVLGLAALIVAQDVAAEDAENLRCYQADRKACKVLIKPTIVHKKVSNKEFIKRCGNQSAACASLNITNKTCTVFYRKKMDGRTIIHEHNHCFGWEHTDLTGLFRPWRPYKPVSALINAGEL